MKQGDRSRRIFLAGISALGAGALMPGCASGPQAGASDIERNKAVALRFKKLQGTKDEPLIAKEVLAPDYKRLRGGMLNLANNARDQGFPSAGSYLRAAFPDRVDVIEQVVAEGDQVGLLFRLTGTHTGNLYGIPPTGRKVNVWEAAILRIAGGRVTEGWFLADEAGLLKQLGAGLPRRKDGKLIAPPIIGTGENGDDYVLLTLLLAAALFFAGVTTSFKMEMARLILLALAGALLAYCLSRIATLPVA